MRPGHGHRQAQRQAKLPSKPESLRARLGSKHAAVMGDLKTLAAWYAEERKFSLADAGRRGRRLRESTDRWLLDVEANFKDFDRMNEVIICMGGTPRWNLRRLAGELRQLSDFLGLEDDQRRHGLLEPEGRPRSALGVLALSVALSLDARGIKPSTSEDGTLDQCTQRVLKLCGVASPHSLKPYLLHACRHLRRYRKPPTVQ